MKLLSIRLICKEINGLGVLFRGWAKTSFSHIKNEQFQLGVARFPFHAL